LTLVLERAWAYAISAFVERRFQPASLTLHCTLLPVLGVIRKALAASAQAPILLDGFIYQKVVSMGLNRRQLILGSMTAGSAVASSPLWAQSAKLGRKVVVLGQSVPLTGAADQIGLAYFNGAKMYFDAINAKNGAGGYKVDVKALDDGYIPAKAAS
jgi:ABC-type branched-subunit amino acid transport system substrate-binding protein